MWGGLVCFAFLNKKRSSEAFYLFKNLVRKYETVFLTAGPGGPGGPGKEIIWAYKRVIKINTIK